TLEQVNSVKETIGELKETAEKLRGTLKDTEAQKEYLAEGKEDEIEKLKDSYYDKMVEKTTLENDQRRAETEQSRNLGNVRQKEERLSLLKTEYANDEQELAGINDKIDASEAELKQQREKYQEKKNGLTALNR